MSATQSGKTKPAVSLRNVWVRYELRHNHHYNLKRSMSDLVARRRNAPDLITAIADLTLEIPAGARVGLVGPNGAGKSTLLAVIAGTLKPTAGTRVVQGRVLALLGGPNEGLDPEQTGRENAIALGMRLGESSASMEEKIDAIREFSGLGHRFDHPAYSYSSGMLVRVRFSTITSIRSDILLVDEGIGAADAEFNERATVRLREFFDSSGTLVMASHSPTLLQEHCTTMLALAAPGAHLPRQYRPAAQREV